MDYGSAHGGFAMLINYPFLPRPALASMERQQSPSSNVVRTTVDGLYWLDMCPALEMAKNGYG
ncbi:hypothetical protein HBH98_128310 [Parastagonospora nodorum]|nr:hypothetical protein HBH53_035580 [Parastagonospora nodorum]KAH4036884.1 hypothetical protein HBI09_078640 [Parastagonospora nodorum]KAH4068426.1 hypothetical protein HBH50_127010 [Parastagonospora nodorum]KAH4078393.1 hypothetical protein HBH48_232600 [Parastagonospora nodorum]KAH4344792.1 hypothetical protein HBH98_128310 [Parastagonospora nodorum]